MHTRLTGILHAINVCSCMISSLVLAWCHRRSCILSGTLQPGSSLGVTPLCVIIKQHNLFSNHSLPIHSQLVAMLHVRQHITHTTYTDRETNGTGIHCTACMQASMHGCCRRSLECDILMHQQVPLQLGLTWKSDSSSAKLRLGLRPEAWCQMVPSWGALILSQCSCFSLRLWLAVGLTCTVTHRQFSFPAACDTQCWTLQEGHYSHAVLMTRGNAGFDTESAGELTGTC